MQNFKRASMSVVALALIAGAETWTASTSFAQSNFWGQWRVCEKGKGQVRIAACTWLIQSGRLNRVQRPMVYLYRGHENSKAEAYEKAIADDTEALKGRLSRANKENVYFNRGFSYLNIGRNTDAIADFTKVIALNPHSYNARKNRALGNMRLKRYGRAISDLDYVIRHKPKPDWEAFAKRAWSNGRIGKFDEALRDCEQILRIERKSGLTCKAWALTNLGRINEGLKVVAEAIIVEPEEALNWQIRARIYDALGRKSVAIADYKKAIELNPKDELSRKALKRLGVTP